MGNFKGIEIPDELVGIIEYMKHIEQNREELTMLSQQWDLLTILGQMQGSGTDMSQTREGFKDLTAKLLSALGTETLHKCVQGLTGKAQVTVDIVIRNLFERTADIGFLATDDDIRAYITANYESSWSSDEAAVKMDVLRHRFSEYVSKYSVYENIILLGLDGQVLCQLDQANKIEIPDMAIIDGSLSTPKEYLETFGKTSLCPNKDHALIYSFKVRESNDPSSNPIGVLCLVFRFEDELEGVFQNLLTKDDWTVLTLLDQNGKVIASSEPTQVPVGSKQTLVIDKDYELTKFGGRLYISKTCATKGYQGFLGLGWSGHAMIPIEYAFVEEPSTKELSMNKEVLHAVMNEPRLFSEQIREIPKSADTIQSELDRTVWNGNLLTHLHTSEQQATSNKVLLWEVSVAGSKTKNVFEKSVNRLHQTVVNSLLTDVQFVASLAIDIMDRNLYERANDCRWWALTTRFIEIMSQPSTSAVEKEQIANILKYINGLYTVYTNLFIFDNDGEVLAVSNPKESGLVGTKLNDDLVKSVLSLNSAQKYRVSKFQPSELYEEKSTYIYGAAIFDANSPSRAIGGIGIVFDSEPQFRAMLEDSLPKDRNGNVPEGCFSAFIDRHGEIISSTAKDQKVGQTLEVPEEVLKLDNGKKYSTVFTYKNNYYAVGACCSNGYREYKGEGDEYHNDVIAVTFIQLGQVADHGKLNNDSKIKHFKIKNPARVPGMNYVEIATFHIGSMWVGLRTEHLLASLVSNQLTRLPIGNRTIKGAILYNNQPIYLVNPSVTLGLPNVENEGHSIQSVVVKTDQGPIAIEVSKLGDIPSVPENKIMTSNVMFEKGMNYVEGIVQLESYDDQQVPLLIVVHPKEFVECLLGGANSGLMKELQALQGESPQADILKAG